MWKLWKTSGDKGEAKGEDPSVLRQLRTIEERLKVLDEVEQKIRSLELDWATTTHKIGRLVGHLTKTKALDETPKIDATPRPRTIDDLSRDEIANLRT